MEYVFTAAKLAKRYGRYQALSGLDMRVPKGAIYGLVGRNGAGKTTLIRILCGLQRPTSGGFTLYGEAHDGKGFCRARRHLGAVVESPSIYGGMTAEENLRVQNRALGLPTDENVGPLLELVGLGGTGKKRAKDFSLGMRQRLGIAVALAGDPDFLALDEPINGLDPQGIVEMRELLLRLNRERQITVLISSHILDELARLATHYGFLAEGRMARELSAEELEGECSKCVRVRVDRVDALARALDGMGLPYTVVSKSEADVFAPVNVTRLVHALDAEGCEALSVTERDESLESFFLSVTGGGRA